MLQKSSAPTQRITRLRDLSREGYSAAKRLALETGQLQLSPIQAAGMTLELSKHDIAAAKELCTRFAAVDPWWVRVSQTLHLIEQEKQEQAKQ